MFKYLVLFFMANMTDMAPQNDKTYKMHLNFNNKYNFYSLIDICYENAGSSPELGGRGRNTATLQKYNTVGIKQGKYIFEKLLPTK